MFVAEFELFKLDLPFKNPFKHAAADRLSSYSVLLKCTTSTGAVGFGECLPREYVTGESRDGVMQLLGEAILPRLMEIEFSCFDDVMSFLAQCDGKSPADWLAPTIAQSAAWCAVDLALLDAFGHAFDIPVRLGKNEVIPPGARYSAVVSSEASWKTLLKIRLGGIQQVKIKVEKQLDSAALSRCRRLLGSRCDIRADANMAWTVDEALRAIPQLEAYGIRSVEQPIAADDIAGLAKLVDALDTDIMADESLNDRESLDELIELRACTAVNIRISKCGGLVAAHKRCLTALEHGLKVQLGCQVGESSLLTAAHLALLQAVPQATYLEGGFGHLLLKADLFEPLLQFGWGGRAPRQPSGSGFGVDVIEDMLCRFAVAGEKLLRDQSEHPPLL